MKLNFLFAVTLCVFITAFQATCATAQIAIANDGKSAVSIVVPTGAPVSIQNAAQELQVCIKLATGAKLPLLKEDEQNAGPFVSLGSTKQAKAAGISSDGMTDESFRLVTKAGNLYIIGPDTPEGGWTSKNGTSNGTAHGIYTFLEDYLDVRWLMPGDLGRDVPSKRAFTLGALDRVETPLFDTRTLSHLNGYANASQRNNSRAWGDRLKLGRATFWEYDHNWLQTINRGFGGEKSSDINSDAVKKAYQEHPEWFAMNKNGKREYPRDTAAKLETTNPELIEWFAGQAIATLKASKRPIAFSLSPSDGYAWSESPESRALYEEFPDYALQGHKEQALRGIPATSSLIVKWYQDVAQIVEKEYPEGRLTGYLYSSFVYPPTKIDAKLPKNLVPFIAPAGNYGYQLYRPETQLYFKTVMDEWAKVVAGDWYYYDIPIRLLRHSSADIDRPNDFPATSANVTPTAPDILNIIFGQLAKSHIKGGILYGIPSGSNGALHNYLLAKMQWNPKLDAHEVQREWLQRAYGKEAGMVMEQFYAKLDEWFREYYQREKQVTYELTRGMLKEIYGGHYAELEALFLQAKSRPMTAVQKERLQLIEDNLVALQWRLRNAHYLPESFVSPLQRSDAQIGTLINEGDKRSDFPLFPGLTLPRDRSVAYGVVRPLPWNVRLSPNTLPGNKSTLPKWTDGQFLIHAARDGDIHITTQAVTHDAFFTTYEIKNQKGERVTSGVLSQESPIIIPAKAGESFLLTIPLRKTASFRLQVPNAVLANGQLNGKLLHLSGKPSPVTIFYVPGKNSVAAIEEDGSVLIRRAYDGGVPQTYAQNNFSAVSLLQGLDKGWLFSPDPRKDGEKRGVLGENFNDRSWSPISPRDLWQTQGFDYHGVAWYRLKFDAPALKAGEEAYLRFGGVDGNTVIYLNGTKIGEHTLGPNYAGWDKPFNALAQGSIKPGENTLAVQVTSKSLTTGSGINMGVTLIVGTPLAKNK